MILQALSDLADLKRKRNSLDKTIVIQKTKGSNKKKKSKNKAQRSARKNQRK